MRSATSLTCQNEVLYLGEQFHPRGENFSRSARENFASTLLHQHPEHQDSRRGQVCTGAIYHKEFLCDHVKK